MLVSISSYLCEPPSKVTCFRDVTLYSSCLLGNSNILECEEEYKDLYWEWLKRYGAWDFIEEIVSPNYPADISIRESSASITVDRIGYRNLNFILNRLSCYSV